MADEAEKSEGDAVAANEAPGGSDAESFEWQGHKLDEMGGAQVGRVEGKAEGAIEWLVARMGRFGHYCLVPGRDAVAANGRVWVPYTRDQIRRAPRIEPNDPLDSESEQAVLGHYGLR